MPCCTSAREEGNSLDPRCPRACVLLLFGLLSQGLRCKGSVLWFAFGSCSRSLGRRVAGVEVVQTEKHGRGTAS